MVETWDPGSTRSGRGPAYRGGDLFPIVFGGIYPELNVTQNKTPKEGTVRVVAHLSVATYQETSGTGASAPVDSDASETSEPHGSR